MLQQPTARLNLPGLRSYIGSGIPLGELVVNPNFPTGPIVQISRTPRQARYTSSSFRPPTVVAVAVSYPLRVTLAHPQRPVKLGTVIRKPAVVGPAYLPQPSRITLAKPGTFKPPTRYAVRKPVVVGNAVTFPGVRVTLARTPAVARRSRYTLKPSTVVGAAQTGSFPVGLQITLARTRPEYRPLLGLTWVSAPTVVSTFTPPPPLRVTLARPRRSQFATGKSTVRPPVFFTGTTRTFGFAVTGSSQPAFSLAGMTDTFTVATTGKSAPAFTFAGMTDTIGFATTGHSTPAFTLAGMTDRFTFAATGRSVPSFGVTNILGPGHASMVIQDVAHFLTAHH